MIAITLNESGWESLILIIIFFGIIVPALLFIYGLVKLRKNERVGKIILIIASVYSIVSFGMCGGFGF